MPRARKAARLWQRSNGQWVILDGGKQHGTGAPSGPSGRDTAERALAAYIATRVPERVGPAQPHEITLGEILAAYITQHGPHVAAKERLAYAARALSPFWADRTADAVKGSTCRAYAKYRGVSSATVRRELGVLQAALNHSHREGALIYPPKVTLTDHGDARDRWLTRDEVAKLIRAGSPHLGRFLLIGVYTGTRPGAILRLRWTASLDSGWVDLGRGILHRRGARERATKKRRESCKIPAPLLAHMRRWEKAGGEFVVSYHGKPLRDIGKALDASCERAGIERVTPHVIKHSSITWAFQRGMTIEDAADYFSTSIQTLLRVYRQHSPEHQVRASGIMSRKDLGETR